jgi:hypothetical protein
VVSGKIGWWLNGTAGPSTTLRSGRDDTSAWVLGVVRKNSGKPKGALQIPPLRFASVGMTKGRVVLPGKIGQWLNGTADPSTALRSGRDDKGESGVPGEDWLVAEWNSRSLV